MSQRRKSKGKERELAEEEKEAAKVPSIVEVALMCLASVVRWDEKLASSIDKCVFCSCCCDKTSYKC